MHREISDIPTVGYKGLINFEIKGMRKKGNRHAESKYSSFLEVFV
jgi:hypothetical protein